MFGDLDKSETMRTGEKKKEKKDKKKVFYSILEFLRENSSKLQSDLW